jgi:hypothetical protein
MLAGSGRDAEPSGIAEAGTRLHPSVQFAATPLSSKLNRPVRLLTAPSCAEIPAACFIGWVGLVMSVALAMIVDGYVSLNNWQALEELREHRQPSACSSFSSGAAPSIPETLSSCTRPKSL